MIDILKNINSVNIEDLEEVLKNLRSVKTFKDSEAVMVEARKKLNSFSLWCFEWPLDVVSKLEARLKEYKEELGVRLDNKEMSEDLLNEIENYKKMQNIKNISEEVMRLYRGYRQYEKRENIRAEIKELEEKRRNVYKLYDEKTAFIKHWTILEDIGAVRYEGIKDSRHFFIEEIISALDNIEHITICGDDRFKVLEDLNLIKYFSSAKGYDSYYLECYKEAEEEYLRTREL